MPALPGPAGQVVDRASCTMKAAFPYVPGLALLPGGAGGHQGYEEAFPKADSLPTIGITKSVLCGQSEPPEKAGTSSPLFYDGEQVGHLLKSKDSCRPIVVAPTHRVSMPSCLALARRYLAGGKLPEPSRLAHEYANQVKRSQK